MAELQKIKTPEGDEYAIVDGGMLRLPKEEGVVARAAKDVGLGVVSGFRSVPKFVASGARIFGIEAPLKEINETAKHITPEEPGIAFGLGEVVGQQFTTQVLTRGKALPLLVTGAGLNKTAQALDEGQPLGNAIAAGAATALLEYITEKVPQSILGKKGPSFVSKLKELWLPEVVGEVTATLGEIGVIDPLILNKELPSLKRLGDEAFKSGAVAFLFAPLGAAGTQAGILPTSGDVAPQTPSTEARIEQSTDITPEAVSEAEELINRIKPIELSNIDAEVLADAVNPIIERNLVIEKKRPRDTMQGLQEQQQFIQEHFGPEPVLYTDETGALVSSLEAQTNLAKDAAAMDKALRGIPFTEPEIPLKTLEDMDAEVKELRKEKRSLKKGGVQATGNINFENVATLTTTKDINLAGYITQKGELLDFSGEEQQLGAMVGVRDLAHTFVSNEQSPQAGQDEFIAQGNIRIDANGGVLEIKGEPTAAQYRKIAALAKQESGEIRVDLDNGLGEFVGFEEGFDDFYRATAVAKSIEFKEGTRPNKIISSIKEYYGKQAKASIDIATSKEQLRLKNRALDFIDTSVKVLKKQRKNLLEGSTPAHREASMQEYPELAKQQEKLTPRDDPLRLKKPTEFVVPEKIEPSAEAWENDKVTKSMVRATEQSAAKRKVTGKKIGAAITTQIFDRQGNVKRALLNTKDPDAVRAKIRLENRAGSTAWSEHEMQKAFDATTRSLNNQETRMFNAVIQDMRSLEIASFKPGFTFQEGLKADEFATNIKKMPDDTLAKLKPLAEKYWGTLDNKLQELVDAGIVTQESKERLKTTGEFYTPRQVLDYVDGKDNILLQGGKKITVPDSGIKRLSDEGSLRLVENDATELLHQVITRTNSRIFNNRANQALYDFTINNPDNGITQVAEVVGATKDGKPKFKKAPLGFQSFKVMVEGKHQEFHMADELASEWTTGDSQTNQVTAQALNILSGSFILKPLATGINPGFAIGNLPRDLAHSWLVSGTWSPIIPVAAYQMQQDYKETMDDAFNQKGLYIDYLKNGGGMNFLTHQGQKNDLKGVLGAMQEKAGFLGEFTEIWTRLAVMNRAIKNGKSKEEATNIARNTLDFYQGGEFTKLLDKGSPYLNAGVQGFKTIAQSARRNPAVFTAQIAQIGVMAAAIGGLWRYMYKEFEKDVPLRDKTSNWLIPTPIIFKDKEGNRRMVYTKIAKDQGQRVFASFFDNLYKASMGEPFDWEEIKSAGKDFLSVTPEDVLPPTFDAYLGYKHNINFWTDERIWKGAEVSPEMEFTRFTPEIYKTIGASVGASPARLDYAMKQVFTNGNIWTSMAGYPLKKVFEEVDEETADKVGSDLWIKLSRTPILKRFIGVTNPVNRQRNEAKEAEIRENTRKLVLKRTFDELKGAIKRNEEPVSKMTEMLGSLQEDDLKLILNRERKHLKLEQANLNDPAYWLRLQGIPARAKAKVVFQEIMTTSPERKALLLEDFAKISESKILGLSSPTVRAELNKLIVKERRSK
jgi:hypothetical protein